jgi:RNA polymerase sigma factor (sigma-70 family)
MADTQAETLLRHIRSLAEGRADTLADAELLARFGGDRDEAAFAELVRRHGPMVLSVCRGVLRHCQDAEDAFQATFLILARKAASVRRYSLGGWLHTVAYHTACKARARAARQRDWERQRVPECRDDPLLDLSVRELLDAVHAEINRLPERCRVPVVLCYLQEQTPDEAARHMGCTIPALRGRLYRGCMLLRRRLARRGLALPAGLSAFLLAHGMASAVPGSLAEASVRIASGPVPARVVALAETALRGLAPLKARVAVALVLALGAIGVGATLLPQAQPAVAPAQRAPARADKPAGKDAPRGELQGEPLPSGIVARLGTNHFRHGLTIGPLALSPDGKLLVTGDAHTGGPLVVWDARTGRSVRHLSGGDLYLAAVAMSPDGRVVSAGTYKGFIYGWEAATGKALPTLSDASIPTGAGVVACRLTYSANGKRLAAVFRQEMIRLWDVATGKLLPQFQGKHGTNIRGLAFSSDGKLLATSGWDQEKGLYVIRLWNADTGKEVQRLLDRKGGIELLVFGRDGKTLFSASNLDRGPVLWDLQTGKPIRRFDTGADVWTRGLALSRDGKLLASRHEFICLWDVASGKAIRRLPGGTGGIAFTPDASTLYSANGPTVSVWQVATGKELLPRWGHDYGLSSVAWSPAPLPAEPVRERGNDTRWRIATTAEDGVRVWDATGKLLYPLECGPRSNVAFSPDGALLAVACADGSIQFPRPVPPGPPLTGTRLRLWEAATGKEITRFKAEKAHLTFVTFSGDGKTILTADPKDGSIHLRDLVTGKDVRRFRVTQPQVLNRAERYSAVALSPDGKWLATATTRQDKTKGFMGKCPVYLWDMATGRELHCLDAHESDVYALAFSPDGQVLVSAGHSFRGRGIHVWDAARGKLLLTLPAGGGPLAFSADGRMMASAGSRMIRPWDPYPFSTGLRARPPAGDGVIRLWETKSWQERGRFAGQGDGVQALAFSADGRLLVSGSVDNATGLVWDVGQAGKAARR